jgi:hypothetical protein
MLRSNNSHTVLFDSTYALNVILLMFASISHWGIMSSILQNNSYPSLSMNYSISVEVALLLHSFVSLIRYKTSLD